MSDFEFDESFDESFAILEESYSVTLDLNSNWTIYGSIDVDTSLEWTMGDSPQYYFHVYRKCYQGGATCETAGFNSNEACQGSSTNGQQAMQTVLARNVCEVCEILKKNHENFSAEWQIGRIKRSLQPAYLEDIQANEAAGIPYDCDELVEVDWKQCASCADFASDYFASIHIVASAYVDSIVYVGSGGFELGGTAETTPPPVVPEEDVYSVAINADVEGILLEPTYATTSSGFGFPDLTNSRVYTVCSRTSVPKIYYITNQLAKSDILKKFMNRNGLTLPSYIAVKYDTYENTWKNKIQLRGKGQESSEVWDLLWEFGCQENENDLYSWKISTTIRRRNSVLNQETKFLIWFEASPTIFSDIISFKFNTNTQAVSLNVPLLVESVTYLDQIGMFKDNYWLAYPEYSFTVKEKI